MLGAPELAPHGERLAKQGLGLVEALDLLQQRGEVVQIDGDVVMLLTQQLAIERERRPVQRLGLVVLTEVVEQVGQLDLRVRHLRVLVAK